jgi:holo-[acyl-carrier protein] synthase
VSAILIAMIIGIGIDIVNVGEVQDNIDKQRDKYLARVFTSGEIDYAKSGADPYQRFAARVAAKEAAMKALRTGWSDEVDWQNIEVANQQTGEPVIILHGGAKKRATELGVKKVWVTLTHTPEIAVAEVLLEG